MPKNKKTSIMPLAAFTRTNSMYAFHILVASDPEHILHILVALLILSISFTYSSAQRRPYLALENILIIGSWASEAD